MRKVLIALLATSLLLPGAAHAASTAVQERDRPAQSEREGVRDGHGRNQNTGRRDDRVQDNQPRTSRNQIQDRREIAATRNRPSASTHRFAKGERFDRSRAENYRRVSYRENRRLSPPPRGHVWVRSGQDVLLVRLSDNVVRNIISGLY